MRGRKAMSAVAVVAALTAAGCEGDQPDEANTPTPLASGSYGAGERTPGSVTDLCDAVSAKSLDRLGVEATTEQASPRCAWREGDDDSRWQADRELTAEIQAYQQPVTRRESSATDEAKHRFRRLPGWEGSRAIPVRGLGDEARLARTWTPSHKEASVFLAVRVRNVVVDVHMTAESVLEPSHGQVPPVGELEAGVLAAVRDLLGELGARRASPTVMPSASPGAGEVSRVGEVCGAVGAARRLAPGLRARDISPPRTSAASGCTWWENDGYRPDLTVQVEAIRPSTLTGESATEVARRLTFAARGEPTKEPPEGADEARIDHYDFESGRARSAYVVARKANLVVSVEYGRWHHPSKRQMERDAVAVAEDILAGYR
ncbi:MAG: hypothetical protein GEV10_21915 [Streptosporangiales bacterium]|nr:hypothetical protein [Streptosporangiales bacterium]